MSEPVKGEHYENIIFLISVKHDVRISGFNLVNTSRLLAHTDSKMSKKETDSQEKLCHSNSFIKRCVIKKYNALSVKRCYGHYCSRTT